MQEIFWSENITFSDYYEIEIPSLEQRFLHISFWDSKQAVLSVITKPGSSSHWLSVLKKPVLVFQVITSGLGEGRCHVSDFRTACNGDPLSTQTPTGAFLHNGVYSYIAEQVNKAMDTIMNSSAFPEQDTMDVRTLHGGGDLQGVIDNSTTKGWLSAEEMVQKYLSKLRLFQESRYIWV